MAQDPRKFLVADCPVDQQAGKAGDRTRRNFFSALGKIGDLAVLNDVGAGKIGEGLRTLTHVSNAIRTGRSVVPGREGQDVFNSTLGQIVGTAADSINSGAEVVLGTVGISGAATVVAQGLNPGVANTAYGQAQQIFQKVKQGNFKTSDIPFYFQDLQNLEVLIKGIFTGKQTDQARSIQGCVSPYAVDLIKFAPKFKFMFVVQFVFDPSYQTWGPLGNDFAFVIKTSTRPTVEFEYDEVNMYNFRTRVPKRTTYPAMTMSFYDDNFNNTNLFYTAYLRAMSPIANMGGETTAPEVEMYQATSLSPQGQRGTTFDNALTLDVGGASLGALNNNSKNILREIRLFHIFDYGRLMNVFHFYHPKIMSMNLDDLNMAETGNGNEMSLEFMYDSMFVEPNYNIQDTTKYNLPELTGNRNATYPIRAEFGDTIQTQDGTPNAPSAQNMSAQGEIVTLTSTNTGLRSNAFNIPGFGGSLVA